MDINDKIFVCGHTGLIGSAVIRALDRVGYRNVLIAKHSRLDLRQANVVENFFEKHRPDYVVLAAGRVGGIVENQNCPADLMVENIDIQFNILKSARKYNVRKLILFGSSCMYPRECPQPMKEDMLLTSMPEKTSLSYAISKLSGVFMCLAYNKQYGGRHFMPVIPNSVYGPNDNFDPHSGHVLAALLSRFHAARTENAKKVTLWGSGTPRREFVHADDIADACLHLLKNDVSNLNFPLNIGVGSDISIRELAEKIATITGFKGQIEWDQTKPDGTPQKLLDSSQLHAFGWYARVNLETGLPHTYQWYRENVINTGIRP